MPYPEPKKLKRPNILWICTDQQRFDTIGATGNPHVHTPVLDKLCEEGVAFTRAYCQSPMCQPSRASFLSGLYPGSLHVTQNGQGRFPDPVPVITRKFAEHGYTCGLSGKLHLASASGRTERRTEDGYSFFRYNHSPFRNIGSGNDYVRSLVERGIDLDRIFVRNGKGDYASYAEDIPTEYHQTAWCVDNALTFVGSQSDSDRPWFLSLNIFDPHPPNNAPKRYKERFDPEQLPPPLFRDSDREAQERLMRIAYHQTKAIKPPDRQSQEELASYYGMIELVDEQLGRLFDDLERSGQRERTLIVFTSDHGEMMGDHGLMKKGCRFYEGAVRVPLIFSWPGYFQEGAVCDAPVELLDIAPTLADIAGIRLQRAHGESLLPILTGDAGRRNKRFVRCEYYQRANPFTPELFPTFATMHYDGRYKLVVYHGHEWGELYDLERDPHEFRNLWEDRNCADVKNKLIMEAFDQSILTGDPGPAIDAEH